MFVPVAEDAATIVVAAMSVVSATLGCSGGVVGDEDEDDGEGGGGGGRGGASVVL